MPTFALKKVLQEMYARKLIELLFIIITPTTKLGAAQISFEVE